MMCTEGKWPEPIFHRLRAEISHFINTVLQYVLSLGRICNGTTSLILSDVSFSLSQFRDLIKTLCPLLVLVYAYTVFASLTEWYPMAIEMLRIHMCTVLYVCLHDCLFEPRDRRMPSGTSCSIWWLESTVYPTASHFCTVCCHYRCDQTLTLACCSEMITWRPTHQQLSKSWQCFVRRFVFTVSKAKKWSLCLSRMSGKRLYHIREWTLFHAT